MKGGGGDSFLGVDGGDRAEGRGLIGGGDKQERGISACPCW